MNKTVQHQAQETNRARLSRANRHLKRSLNASIKDDVQELVHVQVRLSIILWMSWLESSVLWLASHPRISDADSALISSKRAHDQKWSALLQRLRDAQPQARREHCDTLVEWVRSEVLMYAELRNKLAHGQWDICLTTENDKRNPNMTARVLKLHKGDVLRLKAIAEELVDLAMHLITAPASFDTEFPKSVARVERARRVYSGDVDWLLAEIRR